MKTESPQAKPLGSSGSFIECNATGAVDVEQLGLAAPDWPRVVGTVRRLEDRLEKRGCFEMGTRVKRASIDI